MFFGSFLVADHRCKWCGIADVGDKMGDGGVVEILLGSNTVAVETRQTKHEMKNVDIVAMKCKIR